MAAKKVSARVANSKKIAAANAAANDAPASARGPEDTAKLVAALQKSLARGGNMPAKIARIRARLSALSAPEVAA